MALGGDMVGNSQLPPLEIQSQALTELSGFFDAIPELVKPYLVNLMEITLFLVEGEVSPYPPTTEANRPGRWKIVTRQSKIHGLVSHSEPLGYYERGKGSWRPVKRISTLTGHIMARGKGRSLGRGAIDAPEEEKDQIAGYVLRPTSEQLGKNWTTQVDSTNEYVLGTIGNPTSYADAVQGFGQARLHGERGWTNIEVAVDRAMPMILQAAEKTLDDFLADNFPETTG